MRRLILLLLTCLAVIAPKAKQSTVPAMPLTRLAGDITLDGISQEPAWDSVPPLPMTVYEPVFQADATERTEIRVAYDDDFLYVSGRFFDSEPNAIRGNSKYRDDWENDDVFALVLDTFNDHENALWFVTTPAGIRADIALTNDADFVGGSPMNVSWNTFWDAESVRTEDGWFSEIRIPYSSLGFQSKGGQVEMGMIVYRYIARKNERHVFPAIPPNWGMGFAKPSQSQPVILADVKSSKPIYVTPYVLSGLGQTPKLDPEGKGFALDRTTAREMGVDIKYPFNDNLTLDLTVNTDFAQVEADNQQVNLSRFSLFFPEKRSFFQERAGIFDFGTSGSSRLFHSRKIGLNGGQPVRLLGGARVVGRIQDWDVGLIQLQTGRQAGLSAENFGVVRLRRQVLNSESVAGGMVTSRVDEEGRYNVAYGLDTRLRIMGNEYLSVRIAQSTESDRAAGLGTSRFLAQWDRRVNRGVSYGASMVWSGANYNPGTGFIRRTDFTRIGANIKFDRFQSESSRLRRIQPGVWASGFLRNSDGTLESGTVQQFVSAELKSGTWMWIGPTVRIEDIRSPFSLSGRIDIEPGRYTFGDIWVGLSPGSTKLFRTGVDVRSGPFYGGWWHFVSVRPSWQATSMLDISAEYELNVLRFDSGNFDAHIARLRVSASLNTKMSLNAFAQYSNSSDRASLNARFRYHFGEGRDLWIVFNGGIQTSDLSQTQPLQTRVTDRTFLVKYTYTFGL